MAFSFIALGSNQGDRSALLQKAVELIKALPETQVLLTSGFLEYPAEGMGESEPHFLNAVIQIETELDPLELLHKLQVIERQMGRSSKGDYKARVIDLDILSYDEDVVIQGKNLIIPHPRLHERRFVLEPLSQIAPQWRHPRLKKTIEELLGELHPPAAAAS